MANKMFTSKSSSSTTLLAILLFMMLCLNVQIALSARIILSTSTSSATAAMVATAKDTNNNAPNEVNNDNNKKVDKECADQDGALGQEGTVLIPGVGRYMFGSHEMPEITGLDHSIPAAVNGNYLPGGDDTFFPNPGFEIPNPFRPGGN